jgi:hypothetical protein
MLAAKLNFELANGDIIISHKIIISLLSKNPPPEHLVCDGRLDVQPYIGNSFYYEFSPLGTSAIRCSFVTGLIPRACVLAANILADIEAVIQQERERVRSLTAPPTANPAVQQ